MFLAAAAPVRGQAAGASAPDSADAAAPGDAAAGEFFRKAYEITKSEPTEAQLREVIDLCQQGLNAEPNPRLVKYAHSLMAWAHNRLGEIYADQGRDEDALTEFERSVGLDDSRWKSVHNRGVSYALRGDGDKALEDFTRTIELKPDYSNAYFNRGEILIQQGKLDRAIADFDSAIRLAPNDAAAYLSRGHAHYRRRAARKAYDDFTRAIRLRPEFSEAYVSRADLFAEVGDYAQSARDYRAAIRIDPKSARAYQGAAWLMATCSDEKFRDPKLALQSARKAIELAGENYRSLDVLAAALASDGQFDEAVEIQSRAVDEAPSDSREALLARLELYQAGKPFREAARQPASRG